MKPSRHRKPNRFKNYNYSQAGCYFVTICTHVKEELFGEVINGEMVVNQLGDIVYRYWQEIPSHYPNIELDEFVVMPNHLHGLIIINDNDAITEPGIDGGVGTGHCPVPTKMAKYGQLLKIINSFKGLATKKIKQNCKFQETLWQRSFYDHIINHELELIKIRDYIINNPFKWELDRNNQENLLM